MKLYELPRYTYFTIKGDESKCEFFLDHVDGMYSVCFNRFQDLVHIGASIEVEMVNGSNRLEGCPTT